MIIPSGKQFRAALKSILEANRGEIETRLQAVQGGLSPTFLDHYTLNFDRGSLPILLMEQMSLKTRFVASGNLLKATCRVRIWGYAQHDHPEVLDDLASEFAGGVSDVLNSYHAPYTSPDGFNFYFNDENDSPLTDIEFGALRLGELLLRGFAGTFRSDCEVQVPPRLITTP